MSDEQRVSPSDPTIVTIRYDIDQLSQSIQETLQGIMVATGKSLQSLNMRLTVIERALVARGLATQEPDKKIEQVISELQSEPK